MLEGFNGDLWAELSRVIDERVGEVNFRKVKAHQDGNACAKGVISEPDLIGNSGADAVAGVFSARFQPPFHVAQAASEAVGLAVHARAFVDAIQAAWSSHAMGCEAEAV